MLPTETAARALSRSPPAVACTACLSSRDKLGGRGKHTSPLQAQLSGSSEHGDSGAADKMMFDHPLLGVPVCDLCLQKYGSDVDYDRPPGVSHEEYCRWCGDPGTLECGACPKTFCERCVVHNFGKRQLARIRGDAEWLCFCCDGRPVEALLEQVRLADLKLAAHQAPHARWNLVAYAEDASTATTMATTAALPYAAAVTATAPRTGKRAAAAAAAAPPPPPGTAAPSAAALAAAQAAVPGAAWATAAPPRVGAKPGYPEVVADLSFGIEKVPVPCVDPTPNGTPPPRFVYVTDYVAASARPGASLGAAVQRCGCADNCRNDGASGCRCIGSMGGAPAYTCDGKLLDPKPAVFECSWRCGCDKRLCKNGVSSRGVRPAAALRVHRSDASCGGWGARSARDLEAGEYVADYLGELIDEKEASERRHKGLGAEYMHELKLECGDFSAHRIALLGLKPADDALAYPGIELGGVFQRAEIEAFVKAARKAVAEIDGASPPAESRRWDGTATVEAELRSLLGKLRAGLRAEYDADRARVIIDAKWFGNVSRFFVGGKGGGDDDRPANLVPQIVFAGATPRVALFTKRRIPAGEELAWDRRPPMLGAEV